VTGQNRHGTANTAHGPGSIMTDHYDVIVIGSGAGGGTLTYALAPTGKRILLLERGDFLPREPQNWDSKSVWVDLRYHNSGRWTDADTGEEFAPPSAAPYRYPPRG